MILFDDSSNNNYILFILCLLYEQDADVSTSSTVEQSPCKRVIKNFPFQELGYPNEDIHVNDQRLIY